MIALAACINEHWHAVERDLLDLGYHADDIGTKLTVCEFISVVLAAPPGTAVHHFDQTRWSRTDELIANLGEQQAGLVSLNARYPRPEVDSAPASKPLSDKHGTVTAPYMGIPLEAHPVDEFTAKLRERQRIAREEANT
jgi:hypothetical protein